MALHDGHLAPLLRRAASLLAAGRAADAVPPLREAARLQPDNAAILHDLGVACLEAGRLPEAIAALQWAVAANPRFARAFVRLGMALEATGDAAPAIAAYRQATALQPSLTEPHFRAGNLLELLGDTAQAIDGFRRAAVSGPKTALGRLGAARALLAENRDAEAERVLRQALALNPTNPMLNDLLGTVLADSGRFEAARECYGRAIASAPLLAGSYYDLVRCRRITADDAELVARIEAALDDPRLDAGQRLRVHLALGKAADDLRDHALAMRHFDAADALRSRLSPFDTSAFARQVDWLIAWFTPERIVQAAPGNPDATPLLILGMPRSGTTLVEQIVSSHPDVAAGGELGFWTARGPQWQQAAAPEGPPMSHAADYLRGLRAIAPTAARVTDKMPLNFIWAGLIQLALPNATILHCRRAAIDTALSIHQTYFNPRLGFPTGGADLVAYWRHYRRLTDHWRRVLPAERFVDIDYEALTETPEPIIRRLIAACGLAWDDACLRPQDNVRVIKTPSKWQARQPIHRGAVRRWRAYDGLLGPLAPLLRDTADSPQD